MRQRLSRRGLQASSDPRQGLCDISSWLCRAVCDLYTASAAAAGTHEDIKSYSQSCVAVSTGAAAAA
ncbi:hypothetical protein HDV64DRAFT_238896 [Trichoderma sp. TUCIM 5745]